MSVCDILNDIRDLKGVCSRCLALQEERKEKGTPKVSDIGYIPVIFGWFCELSDCPEKYREKLSTECVRQFLYITLALYSPNKLADYKSKIKRGVGEALTSVLEYNGVSAISNLLRRDLQNYYETYEDFREPVNMKLSVILQRLKDAGKI